MTASRKAIVRGFDAALQAADPVSAVCERISLRTDGGADIAGLAIPAATPIEALAIGKAAARMMLGVVNALGDRLDRGFVLTKDGHTSDQLPPSIRQVVAAHPVLDERSLRATSELIEWLAKSTKDGVTVSLISGGGSALLELPVEAVSLEDFQRTTRLLINAGADIHQLNSVRSQISQVKGGRLRSLIPSETVINLIISDVLGNDTGVIASGPTVRPVGTRDDARVVLEQLNLVDKMPLSVRNVLATSTLDEWQVRERDRTVIVADNELAVASAVASLRGDGFIVERSQLPGTGEAADQARGWVSWLGRLAPKVTAAIGGGELTVEVTGNGIGGRNTEFALAAAIELDRQGVSSWTIASLATDGDDAMTEVAGGIVDGESARKMVEAGHDPVSALENNDSLAPLAAIAATHVTGPTGTNVNDLYIAVRS